MSDFSAESSADRNVLLGLLAYKLRFVTREQLLAAFRVWLADKARLLESIFVEQGVLNDERRTLLFALVENYLAQHDGDLARSLADLSSLGSAPEELRALGDPNITASLSQIVASATADPFRTRQPDAGDSAGAVQGSSPASNPRFRILRPLARGGMGQVSVALDEELGREVALKEIQERTAHEADTRDRFVREAEITGQLEHPGVVPVYGLGTYADGRPYYAMRFIRGDNLLAHITRFHEHGPDFQSREFRQLLGRFIDVCQAIAYAHARRVLHRDLKPANIVLGNYGETLVVDWGLAKAAGTGEPGRTAEGEAFVQLYRSGSTATEDRLGTPAYMSPEQAAGKINELDHTTDIYSLGATLYCLLTGQPPATRGGLNEVLQNVQEGKIRPPRTVQPKIPIPLAAICQKAMAHTPTDRYSTALDLATEIENWLADNPVTAHRESFFARSARWIRKHPVVTSTMGSSLLLLAVAATVMTAISTEFNRELGRANEGLKTTNAKLVISERKKIEEATRANNEASRANQEAERAKESLAQSREAVFTQQVARAATEIKYTPAKAVELLRDTRLCPLDLRDLSWRAAAQRSQRLIKAERFTVPTGHVKFAPQGEGYAIASFDGVITIYGELDDAKPIVVEIKKEPVWEIAYSPNGKWLAVAVGSLESDRPQDPGHVYVFRVNDGRLVKKLEGFRKRVRSVAFSPNSSELAAGGDETKIHIFSTADWQEAQTLTGHKQGISRLCYFSEATLASAGSEELTDKKGEASELFYWDLGTGDKPLEIATGEEPFMVAAFDPQQQQAATSGASGIVRVWKIPSGHLKVEYAGHDENIWGIAFSPSGELLATAGSAGPIESLEAGPGILGEVRVWNTDEPTRPLIFQGHSGKPSGVAFSRDGQTIVSAVPDGTVKWWQTHPLLPIARMPIGPGEIRALAVSPGGDRLAASAALNMDLEDAKAEIVIWDLIQGKRIGRWDAHEEQIESLAFSPDGKHIASGSQDNTIAIWDAETMQQLSVLQGHSGMVLSLAFSPDGLHLASGSADNTVRWWNWRNKVTLATLGGHQKAVSGVGISPQENLVASCDYAGVVRLWDPKKRSLIRELHGHAGLVNSVREVEFSPDGRWMASCGYDQHLILWDVETGQVRTKMRGHVGPVFSLAFTPDSRTIITSGEDNQVILWDVQNGLERLRLGPFKAGITVIAAPATNDGILIGDGAGQVEWIYLGPASVQTVFRGTESAPIREIMFTPSGKEFISIGQDRLIRVWNAADCTPIRSWISSEELPSAMTLSPDGKQLVTADMDGQVRIWQLSDGQLIKKFPGHWKTATEKKGGLLEGFKSIFGASEEPKGSLHSIGTLEVSPDSTSLSVTSGEDYVRIFDLRTGQEIQSLKGFPASANAACFLSPDELVTGDNDGNLVVWEWKSAKQLRSHKFEGAVLTLITSPGRDQLIVGLENGGPGEVWRIDSKLSAAKLIHTRGTPIVNLALSKDGSRLAAIGGDYSMKVCDFPSGNNATVLRENVDTSLPLFGPVAISPDGDAVLSGGPGVDIYRWKQRADGSWKDPLPPHSFFPELHPKVQRDPNREIVSDVGDENTASKNDD